MTGQELVSRIETALQDPSFDRGMLTTMVNEAAHEVATVFRIPSLLVNATLEVSVNTNTVPLPDDYHREVVWVYHPAQCLVVPIHLNSKALSMLAGGDITQGDAPAEACCIESNILTFEPRYSQEQTLEVKYYRVPDAIADDVAPISQHFIPIHLQFDVLGGHVLTKAFDMIEDAEDGNKPSTRHWEDVHAKGLARLSQFLPGGGQRSAAQTPVVRRPYMDY